jgi:bifunctional non-homologous end joining protein LigD
MARFNSSSVALLTKNGHDWTKRMPTLVRDLGRIPIQNAWLDGEVVFLGDDGQPAFHPLQHAFSSGKTDNLIFYAFDLLFLGGIDLRDRPVEQRRELLRVLLEQCELECVRFSQTLDADPVHLLASAAKLKLEGLVGKRVGSVYTGERDGSWIKLKTGNRQEFVVLGYTRAAAGIGSLLIGLHDDAGQLVYAGLVRSGLSNRQLDNLKARLSPLERSDPPIRKPPPLGGRTVIWVNPELVVEVKFAEITPNGYVRHAVFLGLREDKPAAGISLESDTDLL